MDEVSLVKVVVVWKGVIINHILILKLKGAAYRMHIGQNCKMTTKYRVYLKKGGFGFQAPFGGY